ncbi:excinuclease ABC subunit C [Psychromicrobium xiongbiense]|uniref:restriction system modified-DNA reader domain-containing protein n=1 Tax=Psychromicrobium xiongbiense TaxID=3051184 RepID=UPI0025536CF6|nr:excinuclease ABC subunit C [Psychromicrobium sp. YIM S02556]
MSTQVIPVNVQIPASATAPVVADFVVHALRVALVNRRDLERLAADEWAVPGIYILLTDDGSQRVYVGQAVALRQRLLQHRNKEKLPWKRAVAIKRDTSHGFNSAEIGYLEGRVAAEVAAIPGITVVEGKRDQDTTLPPHMLLSLDDLLSSVLAALRLAGVDTHKEADLPESSDAPLTSKRISRALKTGSVPDLMSAGLLRAGVSVHLAQGGREATGRVSTSGEIIIAGVAYASPSKASAVALGLQSSNGWTTWHVGSLAGPTLDALRTQLSEPESDGS